LAAAGSQSPGQSNWFQQVLGALSYKDAFNAQPGAQGLFEQVRPFDSGQRPPFAVALAKRVGQRPAQLLQAGILFTLYNANRHRSETFASLADSMPFCRAEAGNAPTRTCTKAGAVIASVFGSL
jgi:hypothetical protein